MTAREQAAGTPGPWRLGQRYGIYKGERRVLEGDGSTTVEERQSICDSLNRDYALDAERALSAELAEACERALAFVESMPDADNVELTPALRAALAKARGERGGN